jgi:CDP-glucose 4,6-dehydratase
MNPQFWKGKTILLTGHTGFKGGWMSLWLKKLGASVIGFSKDIPTKPSLFEITNIGSEMTSIVDDVCNYYALEKVMQEFKPQVVIHMAAQAILRESYKNPTETFVTNVMGTVNVLEAVRNTKFAKVVLNVTSDKCYELKDSSHSYVETDPMGGFDPYSSSKGCAELVTSSFRNSFFSVKEFEKHSVALATARAGNVIGGGDWGTDRLIPDIMRSLIGKDSLTIRYPDATRPWQYVLDVINGYTVLIENLWANGQKFSEAWNFGPTNSEIKPVRWIVTKLMEILGHNLEVQYDTNVNPHETSYLSLDCSKAKSRLRWSSKLNLDESLKWTAEWYKHYKDGHNMTKFSQEQIDRFIQL